MHENKFVQTKRTVTALFRDSLQHRNMPLILHIKLETIQKFFFPFNENDFNLEIYCETSSFAILRYSSAKIDPITDNIKCLEWRANDKEKAQKHSFILGY